jgi:hypothetical protein
MKLTGNDENSSNAVVPHVRSEDTRVIERTGGAGFGFQQMNRGVGNAQTPEHRSGFQSAVQSDPEFHSRGGFFVWRDDARRIALTIQLGRPNRSGIQPATHDVDQIGSLQGVRHDQEAAHRGEQRYPEQKQQDCEG